MDKSAQTRGCRPAGRGWTSESWQPHTKSDAEVCNIRLDSGKEKDEQEATVRSGTGRGSGCWSLSSQSAFSSEMEKQLFVRAKAMQELLSISSERAETEAGVVIGFNESSSRESVGPAESVGRHATCTQ